MSSPPSVPLSAPPSDEALRAALDANGMLREGALPSPPRSVAFTVFAQRTDARVELSAWQRHARQFFSARVGLTVDKVRPPLSPFPTVDAARLVIAPGNGPPATRFVYGRPRTDDDLEAAEIADQRSGSNGLAQLASRCAHVWLVHIETPDDVHALLGASIIASVVLGPILSPDGLELFGVKTAKGKLGIPS